MLVVVSQIFSVLLAAIVVSKSYVAFRAKHESLQMFLVWTITWSLIVVIALFPRVVDIVIAYFGGGRAGLGTFFGMGLVFVFFVAYRIWAKLERLEQQLAAVVQKLALQEDWRAKER